MGAKKGNKNTSGAATGASAAGPLKKAYGDWQKSSVSERHLDASRREGHLPSLEKMKTRAPGDKVIPRPQDGERVCFVDFVNMGFTFPVHKFLRGLMYA